MKLNKKSRKILSTLAIGFTAVTLGLGIGRGVVYLKDKIPRDEDNSSFIYADSLKLETGPDSTKVYKMLPDSSYKFLGNVANERVDTGYFISGSDTNKSAAMFFDLDEYSFLKVGIDTTQQFIETIKRR